MTQDIKSIETWNVFFRFRLSWEVFSWI